jgi:hypothetical protein
LISSLYMGRLVHFSANLYLSVATNLKCCAENSRDRFRMHIGPLRVGSAAIGG